MFDARILDKDGIPPSHANRRRPSWGFGVETEISFLAFLVLQMLICAKQFFPGPGQGVSPRDLFFPQLQLMLCRFDDRFPDAQD